MLRVLAAGLAVAVMSTAAATAGPAAESSAGSELVSEVVLLDQTGDVWKFTDPNGPGTLIGAAPTVDITRARAWHRHRTVGLRLQFVNLRRTGDVEALQVLMWGSRARHIATLRIGPGNRAGTHELVRVSTGTAVICPQLRHFVTYRDDAFVLRVPRSCLGRPDWERLQMTVTRVLPNPSGEGQPALVDNPFNAGPLTRFTQRLYHG
jgi:hypothetical protein